jgi:hypothetical protein
MEVRDQHAFTQDVDTVFKHFCDSEKVKRKHETLSARNINLVQFDAEETCLNVIIEREVPADIPRAMKKFLDEWNMITRTETWTGTLGESYQCDVAIDIHGVPVTINGTMELKAEGEGCVNSVFLDVKCGIPLIGKKLAKLVGGHAKKSIQEEYRQIQDELFND